jgi:aryl sulfotransferase
MADGLAVYRTDLVDSARWQRLPLRPGDIVISTTAKSGTTWMQMICALLIFQTADLPAPLSRLSPWLDLRLRPFETVAAELAAQRHRRFIKTHTPLDGVPDHPDVTYIVLGRDPRDAAVSMYHHAANINHDAIRGHRGVHGPKRRTQNVREFLLEWMRGGMTGSLDHVASQLNEAWRRREMPNTVLVHYAELSAGLETEMRKLAARLDVTVPADRWPSLVAAASLQRMRARSAQLAPTQVLLDSAAFFRSGSSGQWRDVLTTEDLADYERRVAALMPPGLVQWLHRPHASD